MSAITLTSTTGTISTVTLPSDLQWVDEFAKGSDLAGQIETVSVGGVLNIQAGSQLSGRFITLQTVALDSLQWCGICARSVVAALKAFADIAGAQYTLTLNDGRTFNVMFRRDSDAGVIATPAWFLETVSDTDWYVVTINLKTV